MMLKDTGGRPVVIGEQYYCAHKILGTVHRVSEITNGYGVKIPVAVGKQVDGTPWQSRRPTRLDEFWRFPNAK